MDFADTDPNAGNSIFRQHPKLRVIITRAVDQQQAWRDAVKRGGFEYESLPLFQVSAIDPKQIHTVMGDLKDIQLIIVISPNAVQGISHVLTHSQHLDKPFHEALRNMRFAVPGPGTKLALIRLGYAPEQIICPERDDHLYDAQSLIETLRDIMKDSPFKAKQALIIHGERTSSELATGLGKLGLFCRGIMAYRHSPVTMEPSQILQLGRLLTSAHEIVWLLSQTRAVNYLQVLAHNVRSNGMQGHRAIAIHPRIARAAKQAGFSEVVLIEPTPKALIKALNQISASSAANLASTGGSSNFSMSAPSRLL